MASMKSGFAITIKGFIPVPRDNLDRQIAVPQAIKAAMDTGDLAAIVGMMTVDEGGLLTSFVRRRVEDQPRLPLAPPLQKITDKPPLENTAGEIPAFLKKGMTAA